METGDKTILIVEDEKPYSRALTLKLQNSGFKALSAENGEEALKILRKQKIDLVFLDLVMPKMNGFVLLEILKKENINVSVIALSNLSQQSDENKVRELGAIDFINKSNTSISGVIEKVKLFFNKK